LLALQGRTMARAEAGGTLWPESSDDQAGVNLGSVLEGMDPATRQAILVTPAGLRLAESVAVDLRSSRALAHRLLQAGDSPGEADLTPAAVGALSLDLLPEWYDDRVLVQAEGWRQLRLRALEAQARLLTAAGRPAEAAEAARAAIRVEPLRESAYGALIRAHLAEGNQSEAMQVFDRYRALLMGELGLEPTPILAALMLRLRES